MFHRRSIGRFTPWASEKASSPAKRRRRRLSGGERTVESLEERSLLAVVAVYDDPAFVDTAGGIGDESDMIQASLAAAGHTVQTFTGTTKAAFLAGLAGAAVLVVPELENGDLNAALTADARTLLQQFVQNGGGIIVAGQNGSNDTALINAVLGTTITNGASNPGASAIGANAIGTAFAGGPSPLPDNNLVSSLTTASLPVGARRIYTVGANTTVALMNNVAGRLAYLGWDWFDAAPVGSQDGGWNDVLNRAVAAVAPNNPLNMNTGAFANDGIQDDLTLDVDPSNPIFARLRRGADLLSSYVIAAANQVSVNGSNDIDYLTVRFNNGNPLPVGGVRFNGGGPIHPSVGDVLRIAGNDVISANVTASAAVNSEGVIAITDGAGTRNVSFSGTENAIYLSNLSSLTITTPNAADDLILGVVAPDTGIETPDQNVLRGLSSGVGLEEVAFKAIPNVIIDAAANDGAGAADRITIESPLVATGLVNLTILTGGGDDVVDFGSNFRTPAGNAVVLDAGLGFDRMSVAGDTNFTLTDAGLTAASGGGVTTNGSVEQVSATGGAANNTFNAGAFTLGPTSFFGGGGNDTWTLSVPGNARFTQAAVSTDGLIDQTGQADANYFTGVESITLSSRAQAPANIDVRGTDDNDIIALQFLGGENRTWINDGTVLAFRNFGGVSLTGRFGDDKFSVAPVGLVGVTSISVVGGDPTASDELAISGTGAANAITFAPTTADFGSVTIDAAPVINYSTTESVVINGLGGNDNLTVRLPFGNNAATYTPGANSDQGTVAAERLGFGPLTPLAFTNLGANGSVTFANAGQVRNDVLHLNGTSHSDSFNVSNADTAQVFGAGITTPKTLVINTPGIQALSLHGLEGDDTFNLAANLPYIRTVVDGGDAAGDRLIASATNNGFEALQVNLADGSMFGFGGVIEPIGVESVEIRGNNGFHTLKALGINGDDDVAYTPTSPQSGKFTSTNLPNTAYEFNGIALDFIVDGGADQADKLTVVGTNNHDFITIDSPNRIVSVENAAGLVLKPVTMTSDWEIVNVLGRLGNDTFLVVPAPAADIGGQFNSPINLLVYVDGGQPGASDALVIANAQGGALSADLFAVVNRGRNPNEGVVRIFQATGGEPNQFPDIVYTDVEVVSPNMALGANGDPQVLTLGPDMYEPNEARSNAAFLGSSDTINVTNLAIFPNAFEHRFVLADQDFFRVVAKHTGTLDLRVYFQQIDLFLPGSGDLQMQVREETGAVIANFGVNDFTPDDERRRIPVVAGETYYVQVFGAFASTVNAYSLEIINTPAPTPRDLELTDADLLPTYSNTDTGRSQFDDITRDNTPTILIRVDDALLRNDVPGGGVGTPPDGQAIPIPFLGAGGPAAPGYRVGVFDETDTQSPVFLGFASSVPGQPGVYHFTFTTPLVDGSHFITAKVQMIDPSIDLDADFGAASQSLEIIVDTVVPPVFFGSAAVANDGLDPQSDSGVVGQSATFTDRVTNDTTPSFFGAAEADAIIRLYADRDGSGTVTAGDVFLGLTVAVPLDGSNQFPGGQWNLTTTVDLNNPAYFNLDGTRRILATAEDVAGNVSDAVTLAIFIDTSGPQVTSVFVTADPGFDLFDPKPSQGPTPLVPQLSITLRDLANRDPVNFPNYLALIAAVAADPGHYELRGDHNGIVAIQSVTVTLDPVVAPNPATATIVLTFFSPLPDDRYTLTLKDSIVDLAGNYLDGESNASQPLENPQFPSGDGQPGGYFIARFTVDSRPEIGAYSAGTAAIDINGTFEWDPQNLDKVNRDLIFVMGFDSDRLFNGNFAGAVGDFVAANGFDKLAAYGKVGNVWRFLIDLDSDGVWDVNSVSTVAVDGLPIAGDFAAFHPGEEVGVFDGDTWFFDTDGDFAITGADMVLESSMRGYPLVGDFDGDGSIDLATWSNDTFYFDLNFDGHADTQLAFGFSGVLERPVAEDMDQDGMTDVGLWVPGRSHSLPEHASEWFFLISDGDSIALDPNRQFTPAPFGPDLHAQFGDDFALPLLGNFDPPITPPGGGSIIGRGWISTLYQDVLGRDPSLAEINYWNTQIAQGMNYQQIAQSFMVSDERRGNIINDLYQQYIGRDADQAGLRYWTSVWGANGGPEHVQAGIIGSNEYYRFAGGTDAAWVSALYRNILGRDVDQPGLDYWVNYIKTHSKQSVVLGFVQSDEYRLSMIRSWFQQYLGRDLDDSGAQYWLNQMKNGVKQESIQNGILASAEYRTRLV